ncbi:hypothetical protein EK21DRAFT_94113 [Setomelanomma holmii]|uniref:Uncharacterized protein n=1 Tax=Setomelanomma holmii TaxID=210430 RepID=A0A9P4GZI2_9PLEO|nr:hypothetical protein EK21DRAFT_94113 [Setomelanomma holmii]
MSGQAVPPDEPHIEARPSPSAQTSIQEANTPLVPPRDTTLEALRLDLLKKCGALEESDKKVDSLRKELFEKDAALQKAKRDHQTAARGQTQIRKDMKQAADDAAEQMAKMQSDHESQMKAMQAKLDASQTECTQHKEKNAAQSEGLLEHVKLFEAEKIQMDRDWVTKLRFTLGVRQMGYLESHKDQDLLVFQSGTNPAAYLGLKRSDEHNYIADRANPRYPYNRGVTLGKVVAGAVLAAHFKDKTLDERVCKVPSITRTMVLPYRTEKVNPDGFFAGLHKGRADRAKEIAAMRNAAEEEKKTGRKPHSS